MRHVAVMMIAAGLLLAGQASAERLSRAVSDVTTTADGRGGSRVLLRWDPQLGEGVAVRKATLRFDRSGDAVARSLTLRVYPVTAAWADGAGSVAFDTDLWSHGRVDLAESGPVIVDVTTLVKEMVEGGMRTYGFLIAADGAEEEGLRSADLARLAGLSSATIDVTWRKVPPAPRR
jgi:hypothetical protein